MRIIAKTVVFTGIALILSGCMGTSSTIEQEYAYDSNKRHLVEYKDEYYHFRPDNSWSYVVDASIANINTVASSGLLECKEGDIWYISRNEREKEAEIRYRYFISLAKSQLMKMDDNASYIPRKNSKEFKDLIEVDTQMAGQGLIGCSSRLSDKEISKIRISKVRI
ncbi:MAG: hypothetical protein Q9M39_02755 [Sulfurovum sp.]|nr:hypothetical protein [Sulfurovum sp.]